MEGSIPSENRLGGAAVRMGLLRPDQLKTVLELQKTLLASGLRMPLGEIMLQKGLINPEQLAQLLKAVGLPVQPIPGYQILARIGQGGMGTVYQARHVATQRVVALKIITGGAVQVPDYVERFFREARTAARVKHKNVVEVYDAGCTGGSYYLAMEFVPGRSVQAAVKESGPLSEKRALEIARQIAEALAAIAKEGLVHRDIKPDNIIVTPDGTAKLCDFGIARAATAERGLTQTGLVVGTPTYMSPEQIDGKRIDIRSDLYSLGCTLYLMLSGHPPFEGKTVQEVITQQLTKTPPPPRSSVGSISDAATQIVSKLLEKAPARRYRSPEELIQDLRLAMGGNKPRHAHARAASPRSFVLAGAILVAIGLGVAGWLGFPRERPIRESRPAPMTTVPAAPDPRELEAQRLWADAESAFRSEKWGDAAALYRRLDSEFRDTPLFGRESQRLYEQLAECHRRMSAVSEEEARREAALRDGLREARDLMERGAWSDAEKAFDRLSKLSGAPEIAQGLKQCRRELSAAAGWREIESRAASENLDALEKDLEAYVWNFSETQTGAQHMWKVDQHLTRIRSERAAETAVRSMLGQAAVAQSEGDWEQVREAYHALVRDHAASMAFDKARARIEEAGRAATAALSQRLEVQARQLWSQSQEAFKRGDYDATRAACRSLMEEFAGTAFVKALVNDGLISAQLGEIDKKEREARDKEARDLYAESKKAVTRKKHSEALEMWTRLRDEFADLEFVRSREKEIAQQIERCDKAMREEPAPAPAPKREAEKVIDSFDGDPASWGRVSPADDSVIERMGDAKVGPGAVKLTLGPKGFGRCKLVPEGLPDKTKAVAFWARSLSAKPVRIRVFLHYNLQGRTGGYPLAEREVGTVWQRIVIPFEQFLFKGAPPGIQPEQVTRIQFSKADGWALNDPPSAYALDHLVAILDESRPESKTALVIDKFDGDMSAWTANAHGKMDLMNEGKIGTGSASIAFAQAQAFAERKLEGGAPRGAKSLVFYARNLGEGEVGARVWLYIKEESGTGRYVSHMFKVGREWERVVLPFDRFVFAGAPAAAPQVRPEQIQLIRFAPDGTTGTRYPLALAVDHLTAEE